MFINSADDFINPPEMGVAEREIRKVKRVTSCYCLLPNKHTGTAHILTPPPGSNISSSYSRSPSHDWLTHPISRFTTS